MSYKDKNDFNYFKFHELAERIAEQTDEAQIIKETQDIFKPRNMVKFSKALEVEGKLKSRFILDLDFDKEGGAGRFIDADTNFGEGNTRELLKILLRPRKRFFFWTYKLQRDLSLREGEDALKAWQGYNSDIKKLYEYVYNPPARISDGGEMTQGSYERQAFAEQYGGYMEMTYLLTNGQAKDEETVWNWGVNRFLFRGEYSLKKRDVENIK